MARKKEEEQQPGVPAWMVTYGDMMSLLLTFFVLIVSFSSVERTKFKAAISSIQEGLGMWPSSMGVLPELILNTNVQRASEAQEIIKEVSEALQKKNLADMVEIYNTPAGIRLIISDSLLFNSGRANIRPRFATLLTELSKVIKKHKFTDIRVEGHTDDVPIDTPEFPSNWDLSAARALNVVKFLAFRSGIDPAKLSAVGYGEYRPRASNSTPEGRAKNRRVEIYLEKRKTPPDEQ